MVKNSSLNKNMLDDQNYVSDVYPLYLLAYSADMEFNSMEDATSTLQSIVQSSKRNNAEHGITAALYVTRKSKANFHFTVVQYLEGPCLGIHQLYRNIKADRRCKNVQTITIGWRYDQRQYNDWMTLFTMEGDF